MVETVKNNIWLEGVPVRLYCIRGHWFRNSLCDLSVSAGCQL